MPADPVRGRRWADHRRTLEAIGWKCRTCSPWRDLPEKFGSFKTAHKRLIRWAVDGTWVLLAAADESDDIGWTVSVDSTVCRPITMPPEPGKGGFGPRRTRRSRPRTLPRRPEHENPSRQRQPCTALGPPRHRRPGGRRTGLRGRHGRHPSSEKRTWQTEDPPRGRPGRSRVFVPRDPWAAAPARDPCRHSATVRSGWSPSAARSRRRPPADLRRGGIQAAQRGRAMHQPVQTVARPGPADRQVRHRLPGRTAPRRHPHLGPQVSQLRS